MAAIDVFNRFFDGEEVLLSEMEEAVGEENVAVLTLAINIAYIGDFVDKIYLVGGQKRVLTSSGLFFYSLISSLFAAGEE